MSTTIDQKVVEMRFDNKHFENNVQTSLSTLDKLKQKLNLSGASKGLESINTAANNVNMSGLGGAVGTVQAKFSALQVMGVTALANITTAAINAGAKVASALTIDPIKAGFSEYETKINSIQTIMSNTASKGTTMADVTRVIDELNTYADKTIYNFAEMTRNIGTFTAAGVGLEESASAIKGIANLAAASGSTSQQASTVMYQLSQALAAGTVKLTDWNSVVTGGMGGEKFQEALKATAREHGVAVDSIIEKNGSFRDSLREGWITADILNETLNKFTVDGAKNYAKSMVESGKWTQKQADALVKEAQSMEDAATKIKTFTQLCDTLKESLQSGWGKTWEILIGDFEEAKELFSGLYEFFGGFIDGMSDFRNNLLEGALGSPLGKLNDKLEKVIGAEEKMTEKTKELGNVVDRVIKGDFGNGAERVEKLTKAGYDYATVQNKVNEKLGNSFRHEVKNAEAQEKSGKARAKNIEQLVKMNDAQLKNLGFTDGEVKALRELEKQSKKTGIPIQDLIKDMDQLDGRTLLINTFKNAGSGLVGVFTALKNAWVEIFPPMTSEQLYNIIAALHKMSTHLRLTKDGTGELTDTAKKLQRVFKGVFAILDIVTTIAGGALKIAFKVLTAILGYFGMDVLDLAAIIGDAIVGFRDWIDSALDFTKAFEFVGPYIKKAASAIGDWINNLKGSDAIQKFTSYLGGAIDNIREWINSLKESDNIPRDIIAGLAKGLKSGVTVVWNAALEIGKSILESIKNFLGIHSPSTEFIEVGKNIIDGLVQGLQNGVSAVWETMKGIGSKIVEVINNIDFGAVFSGGAIVGLLLVANKIADAFGAIASPFEGLGDVFEGAGKVLDKSAKGIGKILKNTAKVVKSFSKIMNAYAFSIKAEAMKNLAISLGILVGAIVVLTFMDLDKAKEATFIVAALAGILVMLAWATNKISAASVAIGKDGVSVNGFKSGILAIGASLLLLAIAVKTIGSLDPDSAKQGFLGLAGLVLALGAVLAAYGIFVKGKAAQNIDKAGKTIMKMSVAMLLLTGVAKIIAGMSWSDMGKAGVGLLGLVGIVALLVLISKIAGRQIDKVGKTILKISGAMLLLLGVSKIIVGMSWGDMGKAAIGLLGLVGIIALLVLIVKTVKQDAPKIATTLLGISGAMAILTIVARMLVGMSWGDMGKAAIGLAGLVGVIALLIGIVKTVGQDAPKIAATLLALSVAIGVLAGIAIVLGFVSIEHLAKGIVAVGLLAAMMTAMIWATRGASDCKGNLIVMTVAIGIMAAAVAALSMIDGSKLAGATAALMVLMGTFAVVIKASALAQGSMKSLIVMTIAVGTLGGLLYLLAQLKVESTVGTAIALSTLLLAVSGALAILSKFGPSNIGKALIGVLALTAMTVPLLFFTWVLGEMQNIKNATENAMALVVLTGALTLLLLPLSLVGYMALGAVLGIVALTAMAVPLRAFINLLAIMQNVQNAMSNVMALTTLMNAMTKTLVILAIVGPLALIGVAAMTALTGLIVAIGALAVGVGALMEKFPALESFLDTGIPILEKLANAIGSVIGNLISGFMTSIASGLPEIGTQLSMFIMNAMPFIAGVKMVDESVLNGVKILAGAIALLTAADLLENIVSFVSGGSSFSTLGTELSMFMMNAMPFITASKMIDPKIMEGVKCLSEAILVLTAADILEGLTSWLTGGSSFAGFGEQLGTVGSGLKSFSDNLGTFTEEQVATVTCACNAIKKLAEAADTIPNDGGLWGTICGNNSLATFSGNLPNVATGISGFINNLGTFDKSALNTVSVACDAIKKLAEAADTIPNDGGLWGAICGNNSLATFAGDLPCVATGISGFIRNLGAFDKSILDTVDIACNAIKALAEAANTIPNEGGLWARICGDNSLADFAGQLPGLATHIKNFVSNLGTFGNSQMLAVNSACNVVKSLANLGEIDLGKMSSKIEKFGTNVVTFGSNLSSFCSKVSAIGSEKIVSAINKTRELFSLMKNISEINSNAVKTFGTSLKELGENGVNGFVKSFSGDQPKAKVRTAAAALLDAFIKAANLKLPDIKKAFTKIATTAADNIKTSSNYNKFKSAGSYLVDGFKAGISENSYKAEAKAAAMAKAAKKAAEDALGIESPSKEFYTVGNFAGLGFVNALDDYSSKAYKAGSGMAESARNGLSRAIAKVIDVINSDIDPQPTIRPVLDLSDIRSGAGAIANMLGMGPSVGVLTNVGSINSMMNRRSQNGGNSEIVSAINKLRKDLDSKEFTAYNVNGVTYDDGSNVSDAVKALVRAAKIERRK